MKGSQSGVGGICWAKECSVVGKKVNIVAYFVSLFLWDKCCLDPSAKCCINIAAKLPNYILWSDRPKVYVFFPNMTQTDIILGTCKILGSTCVNGRLVCLWWVMFVADDGMYHAVEIICLRRYRRFATTLKNFSISSKLVQGGNCLHLVSSPWSLASSCNLVLDHRAGRMPEE